MEKANPALNVSRIAPRSLVLMTLLPAFLLASAYLSPARAHLWYPKACCNDQDCFRATSIEHRADGSMKIDAGHISVVVPPGYLTLPSLDNDAHICVYRDIAGRYHPRCVFLPGVS